MMNLFKRAVRMADRVSPPKEVHAHCDIPCGIYDPHLAQVAAHTVLRMAQLIAEHPDDAHAVARYTRVKEDHAELCKHEIRIIWGDYFKPEMVEKHKNLHEVVWGIMKSASKARQEAGVEEAQKLVDDVNVFAELFWDTKSIKTRHVNAPYPTGAELVLPDLK
jgi:nickel superoxide dismutase